MIQSHGLQTEHLNLFSLFIFVGWKKQMILINEINNINE